MLNKIFKNIWDTLIYLIYPPVCPFCKKIVDERGQICDSCLEKIYRLDNDKKFGEVFIITKYREGTRNFLRKLKFDNDVEVLPAIKKVLDEVKNNPKLEKFISQAEIATFVPLHEKRLQERGYNQTELIFQDFFVEKNLPSENFLIRHKSTPKLYSYNPEERKKIVQDAFSLVEGVNIQGKKILLVDDIFTTGATVTECAKVLKDNGAEKIFIMAFASDS